jgi:hypothetical protein
MLIEHITKRPNGSVHSIDGASYHFAPMGQDGAHVAEVENPAHIQRFLSIPTFRMAGAEASPAPVPAPAAPPAVPDEPEPSTPLEEMTDDEIEDIYVEVLSKKPHHKASRETRIAQIREAAAQAAE